MQIERVKFSKKVHYRFAIFTLINKRIIEKDLPIRANISARNGAILSRATRKDGPINMWLLEQKNPALYNRCRL